MDRDIAIRTFLAFRGITAEAVDVFLELVEPDDGRDWLLSAANTEARRKKLRHELAVIVFADAAMSPTASPPRELLDAILPHHAWARV